MDYKKFIEYISFSANAHQEKVLPTARTERTFSSGEKNPYFAHPLWCSMMILLDTKLPESIRLPGAEALLFHDVLEDTSSALPEDISIEVKNLIEEMTYPDWESERIAVPKKPLLVQLLKLYDKVATIYDGDMPKGQEKIMQWLELTKILIENINKEYGELNIVILGKGLVAQYENKK